MQEPLPNPGRDMRVVAAYQRSGPLKGSWSLKSVSETVMQ